MIVAGVILLLVGYLLSLVIPVPLVPATVAIWLGWILLIMGGCPLAARLCRKAAGRQQRPLLVNSQDVRCPEQNSGASRPSTTALPT
jgi:hypothetical protein